MYKINSSRLTNKIIIQTSCRNVSWMKLYIGKYKPSNPTYREPKLPAEIDKKY